MKYIKSFALLVMMCLCSLAYAQPNGTNYVRQSDFGDGQNSSYPNASGDWIYLNYWNDVQTLGTQTDWFGPNYQLGTSSHPHYVMLDDTPGDYGALAGKLIDLEYRLVEVNFDFITYNGRNADLAPTAGELHVLLCSSENDVRAFDPNNPTQFEIDGHGQVLMTIPFGAGNTTGLDLNSWTTAGSSASRRAYALSKSQTGTPGNPFTYVGLVWESQLEETRLLLDNFRIVDVCPDCEFLNPNIPVSGCFDNNWISPIPNNYYYYSAVIRDSATNTPIFRTYHQPATFSWNGVGNTGASTGVLVPYNQAMKADITYYSCFRSSKNVETLNYSVTRKQGCIDLPFGGNKTLGTLQDFVVAPSPSASQATITLQTSVDFKESPTVYLSDISGKILKTWVGNTTYLNTSGQKIRLPVLANGIYLIQLVSQDIRLSQKVSIQNDEK